MHVMVRIQNHYKHKQWFLSVSRIEIERFESRDCLLKAEELAIKNEKPIHNVSHNSVCKKRDFVTSRKAMQRAFFVEEFSRYVESTGKTWFECAYELGICHTAISRWKSGRICPSKSMLKKIEEWSNSELACSMFDLSNFNPEANQ